MNLWIGIPVILASLYAVAFLVVFIAGFLYGDDYREAGVYAAKSANTVLAFALAGLAIGSLVMGIIGVAA